MASITEKFTIKELKLLCDLLKEFEGYRAGRGCNNITPDYIENWTPAEKFSLLRQCYQYNGDWDTVKLDYEENEDRMPEDFCVLYLFRKKLEELI